MRQSPLIIVGILTTFELFVIDQQLAASAEGLSRTKPLSQMKMAADPALKYISEDSPYMRSER